MVSLKSIHPQTRQLNFIPDVRVVVAHGIREALSEVGDGREEVDVERDVVLLRNVQRFRGGLVLKAHRFFYHSTLCLRVTKKKKKRACQHRRLDGPCNPTEREREGEGEGERESER